MRDLIVFSLLAVGLVYTLRSPHYGVLLWSLFNYLNPHRLTWGPAFSFPFVYVIALVTVFSFVVSRDRRPIPFSGTLALWFVFVLWMCVTTVFALEPELAADQLVTVLKIQLPVLLTLFLFYNKQRIDLLVAVIALSIGFYGIKGGLFTLATGGGYIVWGPVGSYIQGNNELAIAVLTVIPLMLYLRRQLRNRWLRLALLLSSLSMFVSVVGTQSRGAFLAMIALGLYFWWQSDRKLPWALGLILGAVVLVAAAPDSWKERMSTIRTYEEDASAQGRLRAWRFALALAGARVTGGGFAPWTQENYLHYLEDYDPRTQQAFVAHSIYFGVLGEHGWIGLILYLLVFWSAWRHLQKVVQRTRGDPERGWMADLAGALKVGMIGYFAGGAFLSIAYFDLPWHIVAIALILSSLSQESGRESRSGEAERDGVSGFPSPRPDRMREVRVS